MEEFIGFFFNKSTPAGEVTVLGLMDPNNTKIFLSTQGRAFVNLSTIVLKTSEMGVEVGPNTRFYTEPVSSKSNKWLVYKNRGNILDPSLEFLYSDDPLRLTDDEKRPLIVSALKGATVETPLRIEEIIEYNE